LQSKPVRVRFAPSPTGYLHVGGARTAIFNWLFARKNAGQFLLRIEDTDAARSGEEMVDAIFAGLKWLGLHWDARPLFQSERLAIYRTFVNKLLAEKKAYKCFASKEELEASRQLAAKEKREYKYDRRALKLSADDIANLEAQGKPYVVRLFVEKGVTEFNDTIYGNIRVSHDQLDDFILLRSDGFPTYHLAVVVDDHEMQISHVIRGEDHLSNTPKHILLYKAFGWEPPVFAHLPLILGSDKQRLSKRHGATAIGEYEKAGYLPDAMLNFLSLLGWSAGDDREIFSRDALIKAFSLDRISKKSAVFDETKLEWLNSQYILNMDAKDFCELMITELLNNRTLTEEDVESNRENLNKISPLIKPRIKRLRDIVSVTDYFFREPETYDDQGVAKHWRKPGVKENLTLLLTRLQSLQHFDRDIIETCMRQLAEELGIGAGKLIHPTRLALTGKTATPGLFEIMEILGREKVLHRLRKAVEYLKKNSYIKA